MHHQSPMTLPYTAPFWCFAPYSIFPAVFFHISLTCSRPLTHVPLQQHRPQLGPAPAGRQEGEPVSLFPAFFVLKRTILPDSKEHRICCLRQDGIVLIGSMFSQEGRVHLRMKIMAWPWPHPPDNGVGPLQHSRTLHHHSGHTLAVRPSQPPGCGASVGVSSVVCGVRS